jgi:hypothetical protein
MRKWPSAVGSQLSGEKERELPTPDNQQPTTDNVHWPLLYSAVLIELAVLIIIFYAFTKAFA